MTQSPTALIDLGSNENPIGPSPRVREAILRECDRLHRYPPENDERLRQAIADHHGRGLTAAHVVTGSAGYEVIDLLSRACLESGDEIVISSPTFPAYATAARLQQATIVDVPLDPVTFALDVPGTLAAITDRTRLVYICNPGNPSGTLIGQAEFSRLLNGLPSGVTLVSDEVYWHYVDDPSFPDSLAEVLADRPVVIIHSFSKAYGLAGVRLGYAIAPPSIVERVARFRRKFHLSRLTMAAGLAALGDQAHLERVVALARDGRRNLYDALSQLPVTVWPSQANFVLVRPPSSADDLIATLAAAGIRVRSTSRNGLPGAIRVSTGLAGENQRFLESFATMVRGIAAVADPT